MAVKQEPHCQSGEGGQDDIEAIIRRINEGTDDDTTSSNNGEDNGEGIKFEGDEDNS